MHFTYLYLLENEKLEDVSLPLIESRFQNQYCYCCGESRGEIYDLCDWFQIGGRWTNCLQATKGIKGEKSLLMDKEYGNENDFSIVEIKDLTKDIDKEMIYGIATTEEFFNIDDDEERVNEFIDKINRKEINGIIVLVDCHD